MSANYPEQGFGELAKLLGERWKAMDEGEKQQYNQAAQTEKAEYEERMREYERELVAR
eukprot:CAMPEP_0175866362 /NCGR_PEP_ID=MMETSP0107_2-20121207/34176_1 /TAXON_ID=195067 ORGANISM="Goniomonas pacifica, Strain CCMP1869" /NCGR_SAMPLE_ID=MMETSP0107_2 /ASSEMBLY_ACC=CAM_ASM_000203 /LENGTH=57 /DNA_ID=CAMNT_0017183899 /DNA_START=66 /DNA_END=239 /DNA_ORIENTATION=+